MPRAHLSKRLDDATAIRLFSEHHIVHVRRRKNGEIVAVKHGTFGWLSPKAYYGLQKIHDFVPVIGPFIAGGYQMKWAIASANLNLGPISFPIGGSLYGGCIALTAILLTADPYETLKKIPAIETLLIPNLSQTQKELVNKWAHSEGSLLLSGILLPFGEILLVWALGRMIMGQMFRWEDFFLDLDWLLLSFLGAARTVQGSGEHPGEPGPGGPGGHGPGPHNPVID